MALFCIVQIKLHRIELYLRYVVFVGCVPISEVGLKWCTKRARINSEVKLLHSQTDLYNSK